MSLRFDPNILAVPRMRNMMSKEEVQARYGVEKVYRMSYNESPLGPSPKAIVAMQETAVSLGDYSDFSDDRLRQALAETFGRGLTADHFVCSTSGYEALEFIGRAFLQPGDEVIVSHPTFGVYNRLARTSGATLIDVVLQPETFAFNVDGILAAVTENTRLVIVCNPNNPTGTLLTAAEMERLVNGLPDHVLLVADEVYFHFVASPDFPDSLRYVLEGRNVIIVHTFSKAYGLAGLRLGYAIARPEIADYLGRLQRGFHLSGMAIAGGLAALADQAHLQQNVALVQAQKQWLYEQYDRLDLRYWPSETNFMLMELPVAAEAVCQKLLAVGVMVRPAGIATMPNVLRVTVSTPDGNEAFIKGLETILQQR